MSGGTKAVLVKVEGRVQGVSFRVWVRDEARGLGLSGWVRNEPDGSVSALIGGPEDAVSKMLERLWKGPPAARVTNVAAEDADPADLPQGFNIVAGDKLQKGAGCRTCRNSGFRGRVGIYELMELSDRGRELVMQRMSAPAIAAALASEGRLSPMRDDGFTKVRTGVTTLEEVVSALNT